jgi:HSP20 family molecular chaperone IbpA
MKETTQAIVVKESKSILAEMRNDFADWMDANEDLVVRPVTELTEENNEFAVLALVPGVDPNEIEIVVSPEQLLIKGQVRGGPTGKRKLFRWMEFPRPLNPQQVDAEMKDGVLTIRAEIAEVPNIFMPREA